MRVLVNHEYGYLYYLWEIATDIRTLRAWFAENPQWSSQSPEKGMEDIAAALDATSSIRRLTSQEYWDLCEPDLFDAKIHWHELEDSYFR